MLLMLEKRAKPFRVKENHFEGWSPSSMSATISISKRGSFRRGAATVIELHPTYDDYAYRISPVGAMKLKSLEQIDPLTSQVKQTYLRLPIYPKIPLRHAALKTRDRRPWRSIENELQWWKGELDQQGKAHRSAEALPAHHVRSGDDQAESAIATASKNYSRHFFRTLTGTGRPPTLLDYLPHDALMFLDESHPKPFPQLARDVSWRPFRARKNPGQVRLPPAQARWTIAP